MPSRIQALRLALKHPRAMVAVAELIAEIERVSRDGRMSRRDRGRLLRRYWALVKAVQGG